MEKIAFIVGETYIYWSGVVLALASAVAICFFLSLYLAKGGSAASGFGLIPLAMVLSVLFARFVHWYCRTDSYESFASAMTDYSSGGYALIGVFAGCALAAALLRLVRLHHNLPRMLDCLCVAGAAGIAVGRLASFFNSSDRGQVMENLTFLPFAYPVTNTVSGATEYRLATFLIQAAVALVLFILLARFYLKKAPRDGDVTLIFLMCYGASQVVLDSTRYDKLFFRSNGFVSVVQVFSAIGLVLAVVVFSVRMVKKRGFRAWNVLAWLAILALIGGAGFMEWFVQRHGSMGLFSYSIMSLCLGGVSALTLLIRAMSMGGEKRGRKPRPRAARQPARR